MLEWLKRHAWKACIRQKRIPSSNLGHSAIKIDYQSLVELTPNFTPINRTKVGCYFINGFAKFYLKERGEK